MEEAGIPGKKINLQRRVDKYLVDSLIKKTAKQPRYGIEYNFNP